MFQRHLRVPRRAAQWLQGAAVVALAAGCATASFAQTAAKDDGETLSEIVVTGSLIRGVAPVGTNVTSVDEAEIKKIGAVSTNQVLAQVPVISNAFNTTAATPTTIGNSILRPNIRNLGAAGGNTTLILIDGHNVVGAGILQTTPDAGVIPPGALARVEVVADGGSSIYGADAVGGIVNFITKRKADGLEVSTHYGAAKGGYHSEDLNVTGGTSWGTGSVMLSFVTRYNSNLSAAKRDYFRQDFRPQGGTDFRGRGCSPGTVSANGATYALPGRVPGTSNLCELAVFTDLVPKEHQNSVFGSVTQSISDSISLDVTGFWTSRLTKSRAAQVAGAAVPITIANPFFVRVGAANAQTVDFSYASVLGPYAESRAELEEYGVTPVLTFKFGGDWQAKAMYNYGWSDTRIYAPGINTAAQAAAAAATTTATALNPYDLTQTNPSVIQAITNFGNTARSKQTLNDFRVIGDGPVFSLPGGEVRIAIGAEYQRQGADALSVNNAPGVRTGAVALDTHRNIKSVFGEVLVPIVGGANELAFVKELTLTGSVRYDDYSDFGTTTNPKIGFTLVPVEGLKIRGNYGTSFNAPSLADKTGAVDTRAQILAVSPFRAPGSPITDLFRPTIVLAGGNPDLQPQTADTWSIGADFTPSQLPGFQAGLTFWSVKLKNTITVVPSGGVGALFTVPAFSSFATVNPSLAFAQAQTAGMFIDGAPSIAALYVGTSPYVLLDLRRKNIGNLKASGLDFSASYTRTLDWGTAFAAVTGTYALDRKASPFAGADYIDVLGADTSKFRASVSAGATIGQFTGSATVNYSAGYDVIGAAPQTHTGAFSPVNLALVYNFEADNQVLKDLSISLNIDNVFNEDPPFLNVAPGALRQVNGSTVGRFANLGIRKRF